MRNYKCIFLSFIIFYLGCDSGQVNREAPKEELKKTCNCEKNQSKLQKLENAVASGSADEILKLFNLRATEEAQVKRVLNKGTDSFGKALALATLYADESIVSEILKKASPNLDLSNFTNDAAERANAKIIAAFIDHGAQFEALQLVKAAPNLASVKLLVEKNGLDVNSDWNKITALHMATRAPGNNTELLEYLIKSGANINAQTKQKETPLMWAADSLNLSAIKALLDAGADKNIQDSNGHTASMIAYKDKNVQNFINNYK